MGNRLQTTACEPTSGLNPRTENFCDAPFAWPADGGMIPKLRVSTIALHERCGFTTGIMSDLIFKLTVNQLATSIRMHEVDEESLTMLGMLESLVIAGEIAFNDFMRRIEHLFPHIIDRIDPDLLDKLSSYGANH